MEEKTMAMWQIGAGVLGFLALAYALWALTEKKTDSAKFPGLIGVVLIFVALSPVFLGGAGLPVSVGGTEIVSGGAPSAPAANCPDTGRTATTIDVLNGLNSTTNRIDVTTIITSRESGHVVAITDTSSPTASNLICGETYDVKGTTATNIQGRFRSLASPVPPGAVANSDGTVTIQPSGSDYAVTIRGARTSTLQLRVYDNDAAAFGNLTIAGTSTTGYSVAPADVASGATDWTVGSGGQLNFRFDVRASSTETDQNDFGTWMFVDAATNVWNRPVVKLNGATLADNCAGRNSDEATAADGSAADYCYLIPTGVPLENVDKAVVDFAVSALASVNPANADNFNVTFAPRGAYRSNANPNIVKVGAYQDDSSRTAVGTISRYIIGVT